MSVLSALASLPTLYSIFLVACVLLAISWATTLVHFSGLRTIPGPTIARYTDLLRAALAIKYSGRDINLYMKLHSEYGDVVRVGPRSVSVLDPAAIPAIYGVKARLEKVSRPPSVL